MTSNPSATSKAMLWTGRVMSFVPATFLLVGGAMNLAKPDFAVKGIAELGYNENVVVPLGIVSLACSITYLIPRTSVLGAILLTGYLGGAVASHVRLGQGPIEIGFPVLFGSLLWADFTCATSVCVHSSRSVGIELFQNWRCPCVPTWRTPHAANPNDLVCAVGRCMRRSR